MVDFADTPAQAAWRREVEAFVESALPAKLREDARYGALGGPGSVPVWPDPEGHDRLVDEFRAALVERGWAAPAWPKGYLASGAYPHCPDFGTRLIPIDRGQEEAKWYRLDVAEAEQIPLPLQRWRATSATPREGARGQRPVEESLSDPGLNSRAERLTGCERRRRK